MARERLISYREGMPILTRAAYPRQNRRILVALGLAALCGASAVVVVRPTRATAPAPRAAPSTTSTREAPLHRFPAIPAHLQAHLPQSQTHQLSVVRQTAQEILLFADLRYGGELGPTATVCATAWGPTPPVSVGCAPIAIQTGRGFYTLRLGPAAQAAATTAVGLEIYDTSGRVAHRDYFALEQRWEP